MIRFALIVASTLGFVLTAALGNFMAPLLQELERFRPQEQQEPQTPVAEPGARAGRPVPDGEHTGCRRRGLDGGLHRTAHAAGQREPADDPAADRAVRCTGFRGHRLADDAARLRSRAQLGLRRLPRLALEAAAAASGCWCCWQ